MRRWLLALVGALVASTAFATTYTSSFFLGPSNYVDLGAGPVEIQVTGNQTATFIVSDDQPIVGAPGVVRLSANSQPKTFCQTQHIWGLGAGFGTNVSVTPTSCGATVGSVSISNLGNITDPQNAAFAGAVQLTVGTTYTPLRSVRVIATVAGTVVFQFPDASTIAEPVQVGGQTFPYAVTQIVSAGTTATATYYNLR